MKIAFGGYFAAIAGLGAWGLVFLLRSEFMPYHAVAVGMPWSEVPPPFQVLILTLYKLAGGAWVVIALSLFLLLFGPFRQGVPWARRAIPALILVQGAGVMHAMAYITRNSSATPPWTFTVAVMVLAVVAFVIAGGKARGDDGA
jgi:hypothetical protein